MIDYAKVRRRKHTVAIIEWIIRFILVAAVLLFLCGFESAIDLILA